MRACIRRETSRKRLPDRCFSGAPPRADSQHRADHKLLELPPALGDVEAARAVCGAIYTRDRSALLPGQPKSLCSQRKDHVQGGARRGGSSARWCPARLDKRNSAAVVDATAGQRIRRLYDAAVLTQKDPEPRPQEDRARSNAASVKDGARHKRETPHEEGRQAAFGGTQGTKVGQPCERGGRTPRRWAAASQKTRGRPAARSARRRYFLWVSAPACCYALRACPSARRRLRP